MRSLNEETNLEKKLNLCPIKKLAIDGRHKGSVCITQSSFKTRKFPSRGLSMSYILTSLTIRTPYFCLVSIFSFVSSSPLCWYWQDVPFHRLVELRQVYSDVNHLMNRVQNGWMMIVRNGQNCDCVIPLAQNIFDISQPTSENWNPPHPPNVFRKRKTTLAPFFATIPYCNDTDKILINIVIEEVDLVLINVVGQAGVVDFILVSQIHLEFTWTTTFFLGYVMSSGFAYAPNV